MSYEEFAQNTPRPRLPDGGGAPSRNRRRREVGARSWIAGLDGGDARSWQNYTRPAWLGRGDVAGVGLGSGDWNAARG